MRQLSHPSKRLRQPDLGKAAWDDPEVQLPFLSPRQHLELRLTGTSALALGPGSSCCPRGLGRRCSGKVILAFSWKGGRFRSNKHSRFDFRAPC